MLRFALLSLAFMGRGPFWIASTILGCLLAFVLVIGGAVLLSVWPYVLVAIAVCWGSLWLAGRYGAPRK